MRGEDMKTRPSDELLHMAGYIASVMLLPMLSRPSLIRPYWSKTPRVNIRGLYYQLRQPEDGRWFVTIGGRFFTFLSATCLGKKTRTLKYRPGSWESAVKLACQDPQELFGRRTAEDGSTLGDVLGKYR